MSQIELIILVDDNETENLLHKIGLRKKLQKSTIVDFTHAQNALHFLLNMEEETADKHIALLLDLHMPEMSGWGFLEQYRLQVPQWLKDRIKIVILTSDETDAARKKAAKNPYVHDFKIKPINIQMFIDLVESLKADAA